jgi:hypothetical protein
MFGRKLYKGVKEQIVANFERTKDKRSKRNTYKNIK